ncbi:MAG: hypothetical protein IPI27_13240 [Betaproteobacteria bacterium]|nr:hypothetical protein [Betaproteobacteria bacterium]
MRSADLVVLLLGARYGYPQGSSALSPTHEEYIEARDTKPILVFVQDEVEREPEQVKFLSGVQAWQTGHFREAFKTPEQLKDLVTRAIHDYQLSHSAAPLDVAALVETATGLLPPTRQSNHSGPPMLSMAFVGGPFQRVLRPTQLEEPSVAKAMHKQALFGEPGVFDGTKGVDIGINDAALVLAQVGGARIQVDEHGSLVMHLPLERVEQRARSGFGGLAIIEEVVVRQLTVAIAYADWVFERIDPTQRLTHMAISASIEANDFLGWRTQAEDDASPGSGQMRMGRDENPAPIHVDCHRAALRHETKALADDLMVPLRRQRRVRSG